MKAAFCAFAARLFSLDTEGVELLLAAFAFHHATAALDGSLISAKWIAAMAALAPVPVWVVFGLLCAAALCGATLCSVAGKRALEARMAGLGGVFVFYCAFFYAMLRAGAGVFLLKIYLLLALVAFAVYLNLYLERHDAPN